MYLDSNLAPGDRWGLALAGLVVFPAWIWVAVRTKSALDVVSRRVIPYSARTIWLVKVLAIIIAAGSVAGVLSEIGLPWFVALIPAAAVAVIALRDKVEAVVPPRPPQNVENYRSSWEEYGRLRKGARRAGFVTGAAFVAAILLFSLSEAHLTERWQLVPVFLVPLLVLPPMLLYGYNTWRWMRWPCPRCGCSFRGYWQRWWLPKRCVYCGLPRWSENPDDAPQG